MLKKNPKYSKRINYDALKDLFVESGGPPSIAANMGLDDDKDDTELYQIGDDKSDGVNMVIIEDAGAVAPVGDADAEGSEDGGEVVGWEDAYEQEL